MTLSNDPRAFGLGFGQRHLEPRVSRFHVHRLDRFETELWLGGADTAIGVPLLPEHLEGSWLVDCAGELPLAYREAAAACYLRVFADVENVPSSLERIADLASELATALSTPLAAADREEGGMPPSRLYVMCSQGFNRSALFAGLLLRGLGVEGEAAVRMIQAARPGALSNQTFVRLLTR